MKKKTVKKMLSAALVGAMVLSLAACGSKGDSKDEGGDSKDGVTLEFQQWWGVELPDGALDDICKDFTKDTGINIALKQPICGYQDSDRGSRNHGRCSRP
ncbi:MAG: hypothetical protein ACLR71_01255 [[Clostridium] scindens]